MIEHIRAHMFEESQAAAPSIVDRIAATTRAQNRAERVTAERRLNRHHRGADERWQQQLQAITAIHDPPPF